MTIDQLAAAFLSKATSAEVVKEQEMKRDRLAKIDAFRGLMLKAGLTFISVSVPLFLSATIQGWAKALFGASLGFAIAMTLFLVVLILKGPRQMGEAYDRYVLWILENPNRSVFSYNPLETRLERVADKCWSYMGWLALLSMILAISFKVSGC